MIILGLTGSIGMGKSTAARLLRAMAVPVHEADEVVHQLLGRGGEAVPFVAAAFPGVLQDGAINRARLGSIVFSDAHALHRLEGILHPLVRHHTAQWLQGLARQRCKLAVLDIPLLYEGERDASCDGVIVVSAPAFVQRQRVLRRRGMTPARLAAILDHQWPDAAKRMAADWVVPTGAGRAETRRVLQQVMREATTLTPRVWGPGWEGLAP